MTAPAPGGRGQPRGDHVSPGVRFETPSRIGATALDLLREGPRPASWLARRVLGLRGASPELEDLLVAQLLEPYPEAARDADGAWRLRSPDSEEDRRVLAEMPFAVVDVETTGGMPGRGGRVVEIAIFHVEGVRVVEVLSSLVDPGVPVSPWVSRLTGISTSMLTGAPRFDDISNRVRVALEGRVFVAHNVAYDWSFVAEEMRRARAKVPRGPTLCTLHLTRRVLPGLRRRGLSALARYYAIEIDGRHRARGDAEATARLLVRLLADAERGGVTSWAGLTSWLAGGAKPSEPC